MVEASAQATIGELHQRNAELMRALEDYKVQQSSMTHDLDVARQYVSKVHNETEARISENVQEQISSLSNEVVKWKSLAEHSRASAEGSPPAADPARSSRRTRIYDSFCAIVERRSIIQNSHTCNSGS
jgi:hypothetical protein